MNTEASNSTHVLSLLRHLAVHGGSARCRRSSPLLAAAESAGWITRLLVPRVVVHARVRAPWCYRATLTRAGRAILDAAEAAS